MIALISTPAKPALNLWPHAIIAWFVIFAAALAAWIAFAVRQNMDLVRADYYEEEVHYHGQLDRLNRIAAIRGGVTVAYDATRNGITLQLPTEHRSPRPGGHINFYRPSNAALDRQVPLTVDAAGRQIIDTSSLFAGLWKVRVQWRAAEQNYFYEQIIVVNESQQVLTVVPLNAE